MKYSVEEYKGIGRKKWSIWGSHWSLDLERGVDSFSIRTSPIIALIGGVSINIDWCSQGFNIELNYVKSSDL